MKMIYLFAVFLAPLSFVSCNKQTSESHSTAKTAVDANFAQTTFESLCRGDSSVAEDLDWAVLTSMEKDVGSAYGDLTSQVEKDQFANNFITQFATSFRETGGKIESFTNWRVVAHDELKTEVAADAPKGVLSLMVSERDGEKRISSIRMID